MYSQAVVLGVVVSLLYTELTGLSAGLVIPGYLALNLHSPLRLVYTLVIAVAAMLICRALSRVVILYGRRRFAVTILLTFFIAAAVDRLGLLPGGVGIIGYLIPGIIAREFDRQSLAATLLSLAVTTAGVALILVLLGYPIGR